MLVSTYVRTGLYTCWLLRSAGSAREERTSAVEGARQMKVARLLPNQDVVSRASSGKGQTCWNTRRFRM